MAKPELIVCVGILAALELAASACTPQTEASPPPTLQPKPKETAKAVPDTHPKPDRTPTLTLSLRLREFLKDEGFKRWADEVENQGVRLKLIDFGPNGIDGQVLETEDDEKEGIGVTPRQLPDRNSPMAPGVPYLVPLVPSYRFDGGVSLYGIGEDHHWLRYRHPSKNPNNPGYFGSFVKMAESFMRDEKPVVNRFIKLLIQPFSRSTPYNWKDIKYITL